MLPEVLGELDDRKRDPRTREAAQKLLAQLDDFDRRGDTRAGVPVSGKLAYREIVAHADMTATLPWLRADVPDDVIIAGALELAWDDLTAQITVVASDRGVRNKARTAGLNVMRTSDIG